MSISAAARKHIQVTTVLFLLAITTVALRFVAHRRARTEPGIDDWTLLAALAFVFAIYVEGIVCVLMGGVGKHLADLSPSELTILLKCFVTCWVTSSATFIITKISILLFYKRIFPLRGVRIACTIVGCLVVILGAGNFVMGFLQCRPFAYSWNKSIAGGKCLPMYPLFYGTAIPTLLLNAVVVCLPMPTVWCLQMKRAHKIAVLAVFSLGALVCLVGIIRITSISTFNPANLSYSISTVFLVVVVEPCVAIISVCLPGIQPVLQDIAAYSTIEYLKMLCRIRTFFGAGNLCDARTAGKYNAPRYTTRPSPATEPKCGCQRREHGCEAIEVSIGYEDGDEELYPDGPVIIRGRVMDV